MAVTSDGNKYGVPEGLIYSFPVTCQGKISLLFSKLKIIPRWRVDCCQRS
jgi:hypothetical protein